MNVGDVLELLRLPLGELTALARNVRHVTVGGRVRVRGLVEFSSHCRRNCLYCGLRAPNHSLARYTLTKEEILAAAWEAYLAGVDSFVLQSGELSGGPGVPPTEEHDARAQWLADVVATLKETFALPIALSVGECPREHYALWKEAGATRFLLKHETSDPDLYARLHPGYSLESRVGALRTLRSLGYRTGTGFIIGLPGQTLETLAGDILLARELDVGMCGVGPFVPHAATPMAHVPAGSVELTLRVVAALRLTLPDADLPATTALETLAPGSGQREGLLSGANVVMPSFTPDTRRSAYSLYDNKVRVTMDAVRGAVEGAGLVHGLDDARRARVAGVRGLPSVAACAHAPTKEAVGVRPVASGQGAFAGSAVGRSKERSVEQSMERYGERSAMNSVGSVLERLGETAGVAGPGTDREETA